MGSKWTLLKPKVNNAIVHRRQCTIVHRTLNNNSSSPSLADVQLSPDADEWQSVGRNGRFLGDCSRWVRAPAHLSYQPRGVVSPRAWARAQAGCQLSHGVGVRGTASTMILGKTMRGAARNKEKAGKGRRAPTQDPSTDQCQPRRTAASHCAHPGLTCPALCCSAAVWSCRWSCNAQSAAGTLLPPRTCSTLDSAVR